jgi:hypothetical protein
MSGQEVWTWIILAAYLFDTREAFGPGFAVGAFVGAVIIRLNEKEIQARLARRIGRRNLARRPEHAPRERLLRILDDLDYTLSEKLTREHHRYTYLLYLQNPEDSAESLQVWHNESDRYGREYEIMLSYERPAPGDLKVVGHRVRRRGYRVLADLTHIEYVTATAHFPVGSLEPEMVEEDGMIVKVLPGSFIATVENAIQNWHVVTTAR